jgi:hypothetical protein
VKRGSADRPIPCRPTPETGRTERQDGQAACKPGSVRRPAEAERGAIIPLGRSSRIASRDQPGRNAESRLPALSSRRPSLFGLAPGGACHAGPVARPAVRSYRTLSPLPPDRGPEAVCFLWRYPSGRPGRALPAASTPWSPDFPPEGHEVPPAIARLPDRTPSYRTEPGRDSCAKISPERRDTPRSGLRGPGGEIAPH